MKGMVTNMGKLILCSGIRTEIPYVFTASGSRIYSIEELCHYIYHHIYFIDEAMIYNDSLFEWMDKELKLKERADKLRYLKEKKADLKSMITVILCSADYYTETEIKGILKILDDIIKLTPIKRRSLRAATYLNLLQYAEAAKEYETILNSIEASDLSPKDYGDILHNLAVAKVHTVGLMEAMHIFLEAYVRNQNVESLKQYLYACKLKCDEAFYLAEVEKYLPEYNAREEIFDYLEELEKEADECEELTYLEQVMNEKAEGRVNSYYQKLYDMIDRWKDEVRQTKSS